MDVVIGRVAQTTRVGDKPSEAPAGVEARVLHVRAPRRRRQQERNTRAAGSPDADPPGARVVVLLVPDGFRIPEDLDTGRYRVFLRFARK